MQIMELVPWASLIASALVLFLSLAQLLGARSRRDQPQSPSPLKELAQTLDKLRQTLAGLPKLPLEEGNGRKSSLGGEEHAAQAGGPESHSAVAYSAPQANPIADRIRDFRVALKRWCYLANNRVGVKMCDRLAHLEELEGQAAESKSSKIPALLDKFYKLADDVVLAVSSSTDREFADHEKLRRELDAELQILAERANLSLIVPMPQSNLNRKTHNPVKWLNQAGTGRGAEKVNQCFVRGVDYGPGRKITIGGEVLRKAEVEACCE